MGDFFVGWYDRFLGEDDQLIGMFFKNCFNDSVFEGMKADADDSALRGESFDCCFEERFNIFEFFIDVDS